MKKKLSVVSCQLSARKFVVQASACRAAQTSMMPEIQRSLNGANFLSAIARMAAQCRHLRELGLLLALLSAFSFQPSSLASDVWVQVTDSLGRPVTNRLVTLAPTAAQRLTTNAFVIREAVSDHTASNGIAWFSNLVAGGYTVSIAATNASAPATTFTIDAPDTNGQFNAISLAAITPAPTSTSLSAVYLAVTNIVSALATVDYLQDTNGTRNDWIINHRAGGFTWDTDNSQMATLTNSLITTNSVMFFSVEGTQQDGSPVIIYDPHTGYANLTALNSYSYPLAVRFWILKP